MLRKLLLCLALLLPISLAVSAQEIEPEPTAFMRAMLFVPNEEFVRESPILASYADHQAALQSRNLDMPANWQEFENSDQQGAVTFALPLTLLQNFAQQLMRYDSPDPNMLGFDFFDIAQSVEFGSPPEGGQVILGAIRPDSVINAYSQRGYVQDDRYDFGTLLCPTDGCDTALNRDSNNTDENSIDVEFGREPTFVANGMLLTSPSEVTLTTMVDTYDDQVDSLAEMPAVQALGEFLADEQDVSAAVLFNPVTLMLQSVIGDLGIENADAVLPELGEPVPQYMLAAIAASADEDSEDGLVVLVYSDMDNAETAAERINSHLFSLESLVVDAPYREIYGDVGEIVPAEVIRNEEMGLSLVVLRLEGEKPTGDELAAHRAFQRLLQTFLSRDLLWLAWGEQ